MKRCRRYGLSLLLCGVLGATASAQNAQWPSKEVTAAEDAALDALALPLPKPWTGDFDGMRERRLVRILVAHSKTLYFLNQGFEHGIDAEYGRAFEGFLNYKVKLKTTKIRVIFIPVSRDRLLSALIEGLGDVAAGALTITPERERLVDFATPIATNVKEVVVTGPGSPQLRDLSDLAGKKVSVRKSSSYYTHLSALSMKLAEAAKAPIDIQPLDEDLEDEGVLEMVNAGLLPLAVVDRYKGRFWARLMPGLEVREDLVVNEGGSIAWAVRKHSPLLKGEIAAFMKNHKIGTTFGNMVMKRYAGSTKFVENAYSEQAMSKFDNLVQAFRKYAGMYGFDHLMMVAQGFQESQLDQARRSPRGAIGVMQLLPSTAADPSVGISGIDHDAEKNIHAGVRYMSVLRDKYLNDPKLDEKNRTLLSFAAYNAGPGNLRRFRKLAEKSKLNPDIWFNNVEIAAGRIVGSETVQYVSNIYKYYIAYKLVEASER